MAAELDRSVAAGQMRLAAEQVHEVEQDVARGAALELALTEAKTKLIEARHEDLTARMRHLDLFARFSELVGLPAGAEVSVKHDLPLPLDLPSPDECLRLAQAQAPEIAEAEQTVRKAEAAVRASRYEYIPDLTLFARHDYQNGVAFLFHNYGVVGAEFSFKVFDGGKRRAQISENRAKLLQANINLARLREAAAANVQVALDKVEQSLSQIALARQVVEFRQEALHVSEVQLANGELVPSKVTAARVALSKARADLTKAQLAHSLAQSELNVAIGRLPR